MLMIPRHVAGLLRGQPRLLLLVVVVTMIALGQIVLAFRTSLISEAAQRTVTHTMDVVTLADAGLDQVDQIQANYRGYRLTGDQEYLSSYTEGVQTFDSIIAELSALTEDNPAQVARWSSIGQQLTDWRTVIAEPNLRVLQPGQPTGNTARIQESKARLASIRSLFQEATGVERQQLAVRQAEEATANQVLRWVLLIGVPIALLAVTAGLLLVVRALEQERLHGVQLAARTASHEINNRLATISGNAQLVARDASLPEPLVARMATIHTSSREVAEIVRALISQVQLVEQEWGGPLGTTLQLEVQQEAT